MSLRSKRCCASGATRSRSALSLAIGVEASESVHTTSSRTPRRLASVERSAPGVRRRTLESYEDCGSMGRKSGFVGPFTASAVMAWGTVRAFNVAASLAEPETMDRFLSSLREGSPVLLAPVGVWKITRYGCEPFRGIPNATDPRTKPGAVAFATGSTKFRLVGRTSSACPGRGTTVRSRSSVWRDLTRLDATAQGEPDEGDLQGKSDPVDQLGRQVRAVLRGNGVLQVGRPNDHQ